ncbi:MAG: RluA family pseudouridine synthase [Cellulosilyticaceae bacterium]
MEQKIEIVVEDNVGLRLDKFLCDKLSDYTRSFIQKQIEDENVEVNGVVSLSRYKVRMNDKISVVVPAAKEVDILEENIDINIVYEDQDIIIVDKPQDMVVHPAPGNYTGTLVNALLYHCKENLSGINGEIRPGIVHRIDKDTSGLLMVAKNDKAHLRLSELLKDHDITRKYHAIVYGNIKEDEGIIEKPVARSPKDRKKMAIVEGGRYAKTQYKVLERFRDYTYVELTLFTGRTHQIRVHLTSIGHPLLGDPLYGRTKHPFGLDKQALHAKVLGFEHPRTNEYVEFNSELPKYFGIVLDKLRKMC